jgi:hypothetical protein
MDSCFKRNCRIFEEFAYVLIAEARRSCYREDFEIEVDFNVYALDSTTIDLCLNIFWWAVELLFKWLKQHLKIKSFWGTTLNAVKIQIYCAVIAYCLVTLVGNKLKVNRSIYEILQILSISLLDKAPIKEIHIKCEYNNIKELNNNQLIISGF